METDWQAFKDFNATGDFWKAGHALADWATVAIGPVKPNYPIVNEISIEYPTSSSRPSKQAQKKSESEAMADYVSGFLYAVTGSSHDVTQCYTHSETLKSELESLVQSLTSAQWSKAAEARQSAFGSLEQSLSDCDVNLASLVKWSEGIPNPDLTTAKYERDARRVNKDLASSSQNWQGADYFESGADMADALIKLVGRF